MSRSPTRRTLLLALFIAGGSLLLASCQPQDDRATTPAVAPPPPIEWRDGFPQVDPPGDVSSIQHTIDTLASDTLRGRKSGSADARVAADWIAKQFAELGLRPAGDDESYLQAFHFDFFDRSAAGGQRRVESANVMGWIEGSEPELGYLLVGAHYDHMGVREDGEVFNGADDNASGIAALLTLAEAFQKGRVRPRQSLLMVAFGCEELGLLGALHMAQNLPRPIEELRLMANLDMVGRPIFFDKKLLAPLRRFVGVEDGAGVSALGIDDDEELCTLLEKSCKLEQLPLYLPRSFPRLRSWIERLSKNREDSAPFRARGVRTIFLSTGENDDYHQVTDTIDKIDAGVVLRISRVLWRVLAALDHEAQSTELKVAPATTPKRD